MGLDWRKNMHIKGVSIEEGSIIGAYSIVTKNVQQNELVAGAPARVILETIKWEMEKL